MKENMNNPSSNDANKPESSQQKIKNVESNIHDSISKGSHEKKQYLAGRISDLRNQQETFLGRVLMSEGDKELLKSLEKSEKRMLDTLANSEHDLLKVHCNALIEHSKSFHKALFDAFNSGLLGAKSEIVLENKMKMLIKMDENTEKWQDLYYRQEERLEKTKGKMKETLEKLQIASTDSFVHVQEKLMQEFSDGLDKEF